MPTGNLQVAVSDYVRLVALLVFAIFSVSADSVRVDLKTWGYRPLRSQNDLASLKSSARSPHLAFGPDNSIYTWFVISEDRNPQKDSQTPVFKLHIVRFSNVLEFESQWTLPTDSKYENAVVPAENGNILVRRAANLTLFSPEHEIVRAIHLDQSSPPAIQPIKDGKGIALITKSKSGHFLLLLDLQNLDVKKSCNSGLDRMPMSVGSGSVLSRISQLPGSVTNPFLRRIIVGQICGSDDFSYEWEKGGTEATLLDDDTCLTTGYSNRISLVHRGRELWNYAFTNRSEQVSPSVSVDANGQMFVLAVKTFAPDYRRLDLPTPLKSIRLVAFQSNLNRILRQWEVNPIPKDVFSFQLSPNGTMLAFLVDGSLRLERL